MSYDFLRKFETIKDDISHRVGARVSGEGPPDRNVGLRVGRVGAESNSACPEGGNGESTALNPAPKPSLPAIKTRFFSKDCVDKCASRNPYYL